MWKRNHVAANCRKWARSDDGVEKASASRPNWWTIGSRHISLVLNNRNISMALLGSFGFCIALLDFIWVLVVCQFRRNRFLFFSLLWQQAMGLCSASPLAESLSRCPESPRGRMMCPHSMASCRIWVFSPYRLVSDTIYRSGRIES